MKILTRVETESGKIFANVILTKEEGEKLLGGGVVNGELPEVAIQIVGYGDDDKESENAGK